MENGLTWNTVEFTGTKQETINCNLFAIAIFSKQSISDREDRGTLKLVGEEGRSVEVGGLERGAQAHETEESRCFGD